MQEPSRSRHRQIVYLYCKKFDVGLVKTFTSRQECALLMSSAFQRDCHIDCDGTIVDASLFPVHSRHFTPRRNPKNKYQQTMWSCIANVRWSLLKVRVGDRWEGKQPSVISVVVSSRSVGCSWHVINVNTGRCGTKLKENICLCFIKKQVRDFYL